MTGIKCLDDSLEINTGEGEEEIGGDNSLVEFGFGGIVSWMEGWLPSVGTRGASASGEPFESTRVLHWAS